MKIYTKQEVIETFFLDVIPEARSGEVTLGKISLDIGFNTFLLKDGTKKLFCNGSLDDSELETLNIKNYDAFCNTLWAYANEISSRGIIPEEIKDKYYVKYYLKYYLTRVWKDATVEDLRNPVNYLKKRIDFLQDETFSEYNESITIGNISVLDNSSLEVRRVPLESKCETPYALEITLTKEYEGHKKLLFHLPYVTYGVSTDDNGNRIGYIYAIQHLKKYWNFFNSLDYNEENSKYNKKINRLLNKLKKGIFDQETLEYKEHYNNRNLLKISKSFIEYLKNEANTYYPENVSDITNSALLSLAVTVALMKKDNISTIKAVEYLPIRDRSQALYYQNRINYMRKSEYDDIDISDTEIEFEVEHLKNRKNIVDKFIRTFRRLDYHFENVEIKNFPEDSFGFIDVKINEPLSENNCNNTILQETYNIINPFNINKKK